MCQDLGATSHMETIPLKKCATFTVNISKNVPVSIYINAVLIISARNRTKKMVAGVECGCGYLVLEVLVIIITEIIY